MDSGFAALSDISLNALEWIISRTIDLCCLRPCKRLKIYPSFLHYWGHQPMLSQLLDHVTLKQRQISYRQFLTHQH